MIKAISVRFINPSSSKFFNWIKHCFRGSKYRGAVFACQGIFCIEKQGLAMRLGKEGGAAAALLRNRLTIWSVHLPQRLFYRI
jgi:hypothetical protein